MSVLKTASMSKESDMRKSTSLKITLISAWAVVFIGVMTLIGWLFNLTLLKSISDGLVAIKPNASIEFILAGIFIITWISHKPNSSKKSFSKPAVSIILLVLMVTAILTMFEYLIDKNFGIDQLLFTDKSLLSIHPGRMAPNAVLLFLLSGAALILFSSDVNLKHKGLISGILGLVISSAGIFSLAGYPWFGSQNLIGNFNPMAIPTSVGFSILGAGIFSLSLQVDNIQWSLKRSITLGFVGGMVIGIGMDVFSDISIINQQDSFRWVSHTQEVEYHLGKISSLLLDLEINKQNYLQAGNQVYQKQITGILEKINKEVMDFKKLTSDNPTQQLRADQLFELMKERSALLDKTFLIYESRGIGVMSDIQLIRARTEIISKISNILDNADNEEKRLLAIREEKSSASSRRTFFLVPLGSFASTAILVWIFMLLNSEVTERKLSESALKMSEEKLRVLNLYNRSLLEASLDPLVTISPHGKITDVNTAAEQITGSFKEELIGSDFSDYFVEPQKANEGYQQVFYNGFVKDYPLTIRHKTGKQTDVLYNATTYKNEKGEIQGVFAAARDVTELKRKEEELSRLNEDLNRSNQELEQFAYVASHDLQEPLRMIASFTQLLEKRYKDQLDDDAREFIHYAVDGANRMQRLINDLLDYSRVTTRGKPLVKVDLSAVLGMALSNLHTRIQETSALIVKNNLPVVKGDETQLMRVFQNLIDNAIKFRGKETPKINITSIVENNRAIISIQDNGIGIDLKYKERIFIIFQRLHSIADYPGTGIGLAVCKRTIERHGGKIWFDSEPGKGTTFKFSLNI
jgi:PAS domain S-box-containing protein